MQPKTPSLLERQTQAPSKDDLVLGIRPQSPADLFATWQDKKDPEAFQAVMQSLDPTVSRGLRAFGGDKPHLKTRARLLAADAVRKYDPTKSKASLNTWVYGHMQRLQRISADRDAAVRLPERVRMDAILARSATTELVDKLGHEPDLQTLSEATGLSRARLAAADRAFREVSESGMTTEKGDILGGGKAVGGPAKAADPWVDYVYYDLDPKSRVIFEHVTGYGGKEIWQKKQIAEELGISPAAVSHRIKGILTKLQERPSSEIT